MSWLRIDDKFEDNAKVEPLSDAAHRLWMRAACWCKKPENLHTNGFVPKALLEVIAKRSAPRAKLIKLAEELVNANAGGTKEHGLWEPVEGGWLFHDWDKYKAPSEDRGGPDDGTPRAKSEAGKLGGKRSAEVRRAKFGSAQPKQPEAEPPKQPEADASEARPEATPEAAPNQPEAPDPVPDPDQPETTTQGPDSSERERLPSGGGGRERLELVSCPKDLRLTADQRGTLETSLIPGWAIDVLTARYVANNRADLGDKRNLTVWRKCLSQAISGWWNNPMQRPKRVQDADSDVIQVDA